MNRGPNRRDVRRRKIEADDPCVIVLVKDLERAPTKKRDGQQLADRAFVLSVCRRVIAEKLQRQNLVPAAEPTKTLQGFGLPDHPAHSAPCSCHKPLPQLNAVDFRVVVGMLNYYLMLRDERLPERVEHTR